MTQNYKAVYFPDFPAETAKQKSVTLAFGSRSGELYEHVKDLSSEEIRLLLGSDSYQELRDAAAVEDLPLNTYCLRQLKAAFSRLAEHRIQYTLPGLDVRRQLFDPLAVLFEVGPKNHLDDGILIWRAIRQNMWARSLANMPLTPVSFSIRSLEQERPRSQPPNRVRLLISVRSTLSYNSSLRSRSTCDGSTPIHV